MPNTPVEHMTAGSQQSGGALPARSGPLYFLSETRLAILYLAVMTVLYFGFAIYFAMHRAFWYDELFTFYVATQSTVGGVWTVLRAGMDNHPPLDYLLRHFSMLLFGRSELGMRIPSILAFYSAFLCVFVYSRRVHSLLAGILASALLVASPAAYYAVEGRSYALTLAFGCAALLIWQHLIAYRGPRPWWLWGLLGIAFAACLSAHYYGIIVVGAFLAGGIVLWAGERRFPYGLLWATLFAGCVALFTAAPFALAAREYKGHFWANPPAHPVFSLRDALGNAGRGPDLIMLAALSCLVIPRIVPARWLQWRHEERLSKFTGPDIAALVFLAFGPLWQWVLARTVTHAYTWRYTIVSVAAACVLTALLIARAAGRRTVITVAVMLAAIVEAPNALLELRILRETRQQVLAETAALDAVLASTTAPVVVPHANTYLMYYYYGSDRVKRKLLLLSDHDAALRIVGTDNNEVAMRKLARFLPVRFEPADWVMPGSPRILLTTGRYDETWIVERLQELGYTVRLAPPGDLAIAYDCVREAPAAN